MDKKLLNGVEDTLYIPLVARIYGSETFPHFFYDEKALSLKQQIPSEQIKKNTTEYFYMASVCRQKTIDEKVITFLEKNHQANVVFLGAGLETAYNRINNETANFYQVDLPEVIEIRKRVLGNGNNEILVAGDMFALDWIRKINLDLPTIITVSGVYQYFHEDKIIEMIKAMKSRIPKGELVFDATNSKGLKLANKYVKKTGNENAQMYFSVDNPKEFANRTNTRLLEVTGFFNGALNHCHGLSFKTKIYMFFADHLHRTLILHLALN